jgi:hypothetical protein
MSLTLGVVLGTGAAGCTSGKTGAAAAPGASTSASASGSAGGMDGMGDMNMGSIPTTAAVAEAAPRSNGLASSYGGYVYLPSAQSVPVGKASTFTFHITGPDDHALTRYQPYESKLVVFYLIRSDLTGFRELDPTMREDGTWFVALPALAPGAYRSYVTFAAPDSGEGTPLVYALSQTLTVPGNAAAAPLPAPVATAAVDGFAVSLSGRLSSGAPIPLNVDITSGGKPVYSFERYLDGYAHLTAFHVGDGAFAHVLSTGRAGGGDGPLTATALFSETGTWRVFVQFETSDKLHQVAFTVNVP